MARFDFIRKHLSSAAPRGGVAIASTSLCVVVPTALRALVDPLVTGATYGFYYPFILLSSVLLSWRYALAVTAASLVIGDFLFVTPKFTLFPNPSERFSGVLFIISALMIVILGDTLRRSVGELQDARERESHLNRELQHRVKNTLAIVQALVARTFRDIPQAHSALNVVQGRLEALAQANAILTRGAWDECRLPELAIAVIRPFDVEGTIGLAGPPTEVAAESCVPLVLALHELATNAVKHGALSTIGGTIDLSWQSLEAGESDPTIMLTWVERGGPKASTPNKKGLGSVLLRKQPGLRLVDLKFEPAGLTARLEVSQGKVALVGSCAEVRVEASHDALTGANVSAS